MNDSSRIERLNVNITSIENIIQEKAKGQPLSADLVKITKIVTLAAASVLKDISPYISGEKQLNQRQCRQISKEFDKIRTKLQKKACDKENYLQSKRAKMETMLSNIRSRPMDVENPRSLESMWEDFYQVMGCVVSYGKWQQGDTILGPHPSLPNYKVDSLIKNKKGLQIVVLIPDPSQPEKNIPPIFCCRGTTSNPHNILDDMHQHIGQYSLEESSTQINAIFREISEKHGPAVVSGHSLGGAIAQTLTAEFCDQTTPSGKPLIQATYHFNAPGVGSKTAEEFQVKMSKLQTEQQPKVYEYRHADDIVPLAGGSHIKATTKKFLHDGAVAFLDFLTSPLANIRVAHCWKKLVSEFRYIQSPQKSRVRKYVKLASEGIRKFISNLFRRVVLANILQRQTQKETANKVKDLLQQRKLTPEQHTVAA